MQRQGITLTDAEIVEARGWLADCDWREAELLWGEDRVEFFAEYSDAEITAAVACHYDGGLAAFVAASGFREV